MVSLCLGMLKCVISRCVQEETVHVLLLDRLQACVGGTKADDSQNSAAQLPGERPLPLYPHLWFSCYFFFSYVL